MPSLMLVVGCGGAEEHIAVYSLSVRCWLHSINPCVNRVQPISPSAIPAPLMVGRALLSYKGANTTGAEYSFHLLVLSNADVLTIKTPGPAACPACIYTARDRAQI